MEPTPPRWRQAWTFALLAAGVLAWLLLEHHAVAGDGEERLRALDALLARGEVVDSKYSLWMPLASAPLYLVGKWGWGDAAAGCARANVALFAAFLVLAWRAMAGPLGPRLTGTFLLLLTAASMFPKHLQGFYGEVFSSLAVAWGLALVAVRDNPWGWAAVVVGVANAPATALGLLLAVLADTAGQRRLRPLVALAAAALLVVGESVLKRGWPPRSGYAMGPEYVSVLLPSTRSTGFTYPFVFGLAGILLSFGKGLAFFAPGLWLAPARPAHDGGLARLSTLLLSFLAGMVLLYSKWYGWHGDWYWGPRYFLFASVPASLLLAASLARPLPSWRWALLEVALLALSGWVAFSGAFYDREGMHPCLDERMGRAFLCWFTPDYSALVRPVVAGTKPLGWKGALIAAYVAAVVATLALPRVVQGWRSARASVTAWRERPWRW